MYLCQIQIYNLINIINKIIYYISTKGGTQFDCFKLLTKIFILLWSKNMSANENIDINLINNVNKEKNKEKKADPESLNIYDIINICIEYNKLGYNIQKQVKAILESGVEQSIRNGKITSESIPHIKQFLSYICENSYSSEASEQAFQCYLMIEEFEHEYPKYFLKHKN